jgi:hypothetical protein
VADNGRGIADERAEVVDAAADAEAVRSLAIAKAGDSLVVADVRSDDDHGAGRDIDTAAQAIAAEGAVVTNGGIENGRSAAGDVETGETLKSDLLLDKKCHTFL